MSSTPQVFIIESLKLEDEVHDRFEGKVLSEMLKFTGSETKYFYIRTKKEFQEVMGIFSKSKFRYLHISCHGHGEGIALTLDYISFADLKGLLSPYLENKRVFFSSCEVMNDELAMSLLHKTDCYSVIGPSKNINFDRAAAFWSSFYHLMLRDEARSMKRSKIKKYVESLQQLFEVHMRFFSTSSKNRKGFFEVKLESDPSKK